MILTSSSLYLHDPHLILSSAHLHDPHLILTLSCQAEFLASCDKYNITRGLYYTISNSHCKFLPNTDCTAVVLDAFMELATNYGNISQFWFDHGDSLFIDAVNTHQPGASVLGREWTLVGTEGGYVSAGQNALWYPKYPGWSAPTSNVSANPWIAYQCDTSIAGHWFWHAYPSAHHGIAGPDPKPIYSPQEAVDLYGVQCIGVGAGLIVNMPPSTRGEIEPVFTAWAKGFSAEWEKRFGTAVASINTSTSVATNLGPDGDTNGRSAMVAELFPGHSVIDCVIVKEDLRFGQRVAAWVLEIEVTNSNKWIQVASGSTIGTTRIVGLGKDHFTPGLLCEEVYDAKAGRRACANVSAPLPSYQYLPHYATQGVRAVRFRPTLSAAPDGLVHIAELSAFNSNASRSAAKH